MTDEEMVEHHTKYKEIDGYDETVWMTRSEHTKLHLRLRIEGKCNVSPEELTKISGAANHRTDKAKERKKEWRKKYYEEHKDEIKKHKKEYYENNKEKIKEATKEWRKKNPGWCKEREAQRRIKDRKKLEKTKARKSYTSGIKKDPRL